MLRQKLIPYIKVLPDVAKAILTDNVSDLEKLLNKGASLNHIDLSKLQEIFFCGRSWKYLPPLSLAAAVGSTGAVKLLIQKGASRYHCSPYEVAMEHEYLEITKLLPSCFDGTRFLYQFLLALNYPYSDSYKNGTCNGIGRMARQATMTGQLNLFNKRIKLMYEIFHKEEEKGLKEFKLNYKDHRLFDEDGKYLNEKLGVFIRNNLHFRVNSDEHLRVDIYVILRWFMPLPGSTKIRVAR